MSLVRLTRSATRCVTVAQVKQNERVNHTVEDDMIALYIDAAEDLIELRTNRTIMQSTYRLTSDRLTSGMTVLRPGLAGQPRAISAYTASGDDDLSPFDIDTLIASGDSMAPLFLFPGLSGLRAGRGKMQIDYEVGAATADEVPSGMKLAVLHLASHWYRSREAVSTDSRMRAGENPLPLGAEAMIQAYRIPNINVSYEDRTSGERNARNR